MELAEAVGGSASPDPSPAAVSEPTPSSPSGRMSDDEILDSIQADEPSPVEPQSAAKAPEQAVEAPTPPPQEDLSAIPSPKWNSLTEEQKAFLSQDKALRATFFRESRYSQAFPNVAEAEEIRQLYPTNELAKEAFQLAAANHNISRLFNTDEQGFVAELARVNPERLPNIAAAMRHTAYQANPGAYNESVTKPAVLDTLENLREIHSSDENVQAAVEILKNALGVRNGQPQSDPLENDPRLLQLEQLQRQAAGAQEQALRAFESSVHAGYNESLDKAVTEAIGSPAGFDKEALGKAKGEVIKAINDELNANPALWNAFQARLQSGGRDQGHYQAAVGFPLMYAKQILGKHVQATLSWWTPRIVAKNQADVAKVASAPKNKDIGAGSGARQQAKPDVPPRDPRTGKFTYRREDGSRLTDDDILDGNF